jgi:hypothetical protein
VINTREKGAAAALAGQSIDSNPYRPYHTRRNPNGYHSEVTNASYYDWRAGYNAAIVGMVCSTIRQVLTGHPGMYELEFGLAVMNAYSGELTTALMNAAISSMVLSGELVEDLGLYKLASKETTC